MESKMLGGENTVFYKKLFTLVLPIAFQQFMLAAVSASDALMLGFVNQDALSAVSLAGQVTFVFNLFMGGLTMGTSILAAQYYGKRDVPSIERIFAYVTSVSFLISVVFFLASLVFPSALMKIFTGEPQLISDGSVYLRAVSSRGRCEKYGDRIKRRRHQYLPERRADIWSFFLPGNGNCRSRPCDLNFKID